MSYFELNASDQEDFDKKLISLLLTIHNQKHKLSGISDVNTYFEFLTNFEKESETPRPIQITEDTTITSEQINTLRERNYPEEYIQWAQKYGQYSIWIESARIVSVADALEEANGYYNLLPANNYQIFASDGSGNMFAFDRNEPGNQIRFFDHNSYTNTESIEDLYSEVYDYYEDENDTLINPNNLDQAAIFDPEGNYSTNSTYIQKYLLDSEVSRPVAENELLPFLLTQTFEGFNQIIDRFSSKIYAVSKKLVLSGAVDNGINCYTELIETNPKNAVYYNNRACLYRYAKRYDSAIQDAEKAISLDKSDGLYYGTLAEILSDIDDHDGFFRNLEPALKNGMPIGDLENTIIEKYKSDPRFEALNSQ